MTIPANLAQAKAAEHAVAAELLFRGLNPSFPAVDTGVDMYVNGTLRVQVKSTRMRANQVTPQGGYWFKLRQGPIVSGNNTIKKRPPRMFSEQVDFVVLVGVEPRRYWIVPAAELDLVQCLVINSIETWPVVDEEKIRKLFGEPIARQGEKQPSRATVRETHERLRGSNGLTQKEVADLCGVSQFTVSKVIRGKYGRGLKTERKGLGQHIKRQYEGRWELLFDHLKLEEEISAIAANPAAVLQEKV